ncbi:MAG TPA: hypothetical protein VGY31_02905 [Terriglobia bacterium]|nr:hypothetical protein [Terriglobia bacterium]
MRKTSTRSHFTHLTLAAALLLSTLLLMGAPIAAAQAQAPGGNYSGDFFIITSVNKKNHELFLKAPTEVTKLVLVNDKTEFLDQEGKRMTFADLHAGDTVYVTTDRSSAGAEPVAARVQEGPMTSAILHSRYLK